MIRNMSALLLFAGICQSGWCQQPRIEAAFSVLQDGHPVMTIKNNYVHPITGFIMTVNPGGANLSTSDEARSYHDVYINHHYDRKIARGDSQTIAVPYIVGIDVSTLKPQVRAVVFEDGSSWGEDPWISKIAAMRRRLFEELAVLQEVVENGIKASSPVETLVTQVEAERNLRQLADQSADLEISLIDNLAVDNFVQGIRDAPLSSGNPRALSKAVSLRARLQEWRQALGGASSPPVSSAPHTPLGSPEARVQPPTYVLASLKAKLAMPFSIIQQQCTVSNASFMVGTPTSCGTVAWELVAMASDGVKLDEGQTTAFGQCYGNYTDCDGTFHPGTSTPTAAVHLQQSSFTDGNTPAVKFGWKIDNWQAATYQACSCDDPDPSGETENPPVLGAILGTFFIHDCG